MKMMTLQCICTKAILNLEHIPLGLCPEEDTKSMIENHMKNSNNEEFWKEQNKQDLFIPQC